MTPSTYAQFMLSIPTPPLPVVFAVLWLVNVLIVDFIKDATLRRDRALYTVVAFFTMWAQGVVYVLQAGLIR